MDWSSDAPTASVECPRLRRWLSAQDALSTTSTVGQSDLLNDADRNSLLQQIISAKRRLVWVESADATTTRTAIEFAQHFNATIHVASSTGSDNVAHVKQSRGMLGTSLAELHQRADTVLHVGDLHLRELPMLQKRFLRDDMRQLFIEPDLDSLTDVLLGKNTEICAALESSAYSVILWAEDLLSDEMDQLIVIRLEELTRKISQTSRCCLLPLPIDAGRITAHETALWLTNIAGTSVYHEGRWQTAMVKDYTELEQWRHNFDWIVCIRTLPSDRPLPQLSFDWIIDAKCNLRSNMRYFSPSDKQRVTPVAAVGIETQGHLARIDQAFVAHVPACKSAQRSSAISCLRSLMQRGDR